MIMQERENNKSPDSCFTTHSLPEVAKERALDFDCLLLSAHNPRLTAQPKKSCLIDWDKNSSWIVLYEYSQSDKTFLVERSNRQDFFG